MNPSVLRILVPVLLAAKRTEEIAREVSLEQARLAPIPALQHCLREQSKQEAMHASSFEAALLLMPAAPAPSKMLKALDDLGARLRSDTAAGNLPASMIGLQYVLEGLGSVALSPPQGEFAETGDAFVPIRDLVLHQEIAHRRLGEVWVPRLCRHLDTKDLAALAVAGRDYAALGAAVVEAGLPLLEELETDREHYLRRARGFIESLYHDPLVLPPINEEHLA